MPPRRLVRRQPLADRIKAYLNPLDFLLWLSEELDSGDWEQWQRDWSALIGVGLNILMLIARANTGWKRVGGDDVFGDEVRGPGWLGWFAAFLVYFLSIFSFTNAAYTFYRKRNYRLFEASVDAPPSTPSAHRVRVDSSPVSSSPLRFFSSMIVANGAEARAHPDSQRDVWEVSVWDPTPICLKLFCMFSPGHVLVYWLFLPITNLDARPSTTIFTTIVLAALLSVQLSALQSSFSQQSKDTSVIHKEVLNEYNTKYVHPRTQPFMRDVGTQFSGSSRSKHRPGHAESEDGVDIYSPVVVVNRGFQTNPNPNYAGHVDPDSLRKQETPPRGIGNGGLPTFPTHSHFGDLSSPIQPRTALRQPQYRSSVGPGGGDGGSLGIYTHANSPLKKAASTHFAVGLQERERSSSPIKRPSSPTKRISVPAGLNGIAANQRFAHLRGPARRESDRF